MLCVTNCPPGLRGDLSKWLNEINTGVYVGRLSARVRDELWDRVCTNIRNGQATMVYSANNEQRYVFLAHNTSWTPVDFEGITLMRKPLVQAETEENEVLPRGFSKAAKYQKVSHLKNSKASSGYIVIHTEATGQDFNLDRITEIALLKIAGNEIVDQFECLIKSEKSLSADFGRLTGITDDLVEAKGLSEKEAFDKVQEFIGDNLVVGYDIQFHVNFVKRLGQRAGKDSIIKRTRDVQHIARRELDDLENYRMETVAEYFSLDVGKVRRALEDCILVYRIYAKLNEL